VVDAKNTKRKDKEDNEKIIMGCKVSVKDEGLVQVYLNIEKNVLYCIANGKIQEKFDIGNYY
jgi:hypothetical protein